MSRKSSTHLTVHIQNVKSQTTNQPIQSSIPPSITRTILPFTISANLNLRFKRREVSKQQTIKPVTYLLSFHSSQSKSQTTNNESTNPIPASFIYTRTTLPFIEPDNPNLQYKQRKVKELQTI